MIGKPCKVGSIFVASASTLELGWTGSEDAIKEGKDRDNVISPNAEADANDVPPSTPPPLSYFLGGLGGGGGHWPPLSTTTSTLVPGNPAKSVFTYYFDKN